MKYLIIFFLMLPAFAWAQNAIQTDTTYRVNTGGKFYEVREITFLNGEASTTKTLIGDTSTLYKNYYAAFVRAGTQMANDARQASRFDKDIAQIIAQNTATLAATGRDVLDTLTKQYAGPLISGNWSVQDTALRDISFVINGNGKLRYTITGYAQRGAVLIANTMRLQNYKSSGQSVDLYKSPGGNWFSIDDKVKLKLPGNPLQNRQPDPAPAVVTPAKPLPANASKTPAKPPKKGKKKAAKQ